MRSIALLMLLLAFSFAVASPSIEDGKNLVSANGCMACHGMDGNGVAGTTAQTYPVLAGQHADYLDEALKAYRSGARQNAIMGAFARPLTDQDIASLALYFSIQKSRLHKMDEK